jgi:hypothetical protein
MRDLLHQELPLDIRDAFAVGTLDIDPAEHHEICRRHNIVNVPFLALYRDGSLIQTITGMRKPDE